MSKVVLPVLYKSLIEIFKFLEKKCYQSFINESAIVFEFSNFLLSFHFEENSEEDTEEEDNDTSSILNEKIFEEHIPKLTKEITLWNSELLAWREDKNSDNPPLSFSSSLFEYLRILKELDNDIILDYKVKMNSGDQMCGDDSSYGFEINLNFNFLNSVTRYQSFLTTLNSAQVKFIPPKFYWKYYVKNEPLKDNYEINIVNTNTKARRLGYFKLLAFFFISNSRIPNNIIYKKFESFVEPFQEHIQNYRNNKGVVIKSKSGISAKPYIEISKDFKLITKTNGFIRASKLFKVYVTIVNEFQYTNIFELNKFDKLFFFEMLLKQDFLYIAFLIELIYVNQRVTFQSLAQSFKNHLLDRLNEIKNYSIWGDNSSKTIKEINKIIKRINSWKKEEVYLEHVLMPRLNWLLDLDLLSDEDDVFTLTQNGVQVFQNINSWYDINSARVISPLEFLNRFSINIFDSMSLNSSNTINKLSQEMVNKKIETHLEKSFDYFRTLAPNRITSSQAINYTKYMVYLKENIIVSYQYIENLLNKNSFPQFIYKYQSQYLDGYIQKRS